MPKHFKGAIDEGYVVGLAWSGQVFVVADNIEEAIQKMIDQDIDFAGFETGQKVKVIR